MESSMNGKRTNNLMLVVFTTLLLKVIAGE